MSRISLLRLCAVLTLGVLAARADAIVIRHDVADGAYLTSETDFPALFGVYRTKAGHKDCVATLISSRWAVTAAHCARGKDLLAGATPTGKGFAVEIGGRKQLITRVVHHPGNGRGRAPDVALLQLASPVTHVAPLPLYRSRDEEGRVVLIPGWGGTGNGQSGLAAEDGLFRAAENRVDRVETGKIWWRFDAPGPNTRALTLEGISGPGDSGGPALLRTPTGWAVVGISSAQDTKDGAEGLYGVDEVFVRVSEFAKWIDTYVNNARPRR